MATLQGASKAKEDSSMEEEKREERESITPLMLASPNVGMLTGKGAELVDLMKRRKVSILHLQETRWKGAKAREMGCGYKLYYNGWMQECCWDHAGARVDRKSD